MLGLSEGTQIAVITTLGSIIALIAYSFRYMKDRRSQVRQQRFENYHNLVSDLVKGRKEQKGPFLSSQMAVVYELRNYREYKDVSIRILEGERDGWLKKPEHKRLIKEIDITLRDLRKKRLREKVKFFKANAQGGRNSL